jgi:hypothetical protein
MAVTYFFPDLLEDVGMFSKLGEKPGCHSTRHILSGDKYIHDNLTDLNDALVLLDKAIN